MIGYLTLGTNDLERAAAFYDALLGEIGASRAYRTDTLVAWSFGKGSTLLVLNTPFDAAPATTGNGTMVALNVGDIDAVDHLHARAIDLGGTDEGAPGPRGTSFYAGYFRDPDGNKLNVFCYP
jgi:catechol 2,3-dioxygenase-like lactoylglutathione lyase family enzyme